MSDQDPRNNPAPWLDRWELVPTGEPLVTHCSVLVPAMQRERPVMLKLTQEPDEQIGGSVLAWWGGNGAVEVLAQDQDGGAVLMERATGTDSLYERALKGDDTFAIEILCRTASSLHSVTAPNPPDVPSLETWFEALLETRDKRREVKAGRRLLLNLLESERDVTILHGDIHHRNVLDAGDGRWLAIDPKGIKGERTHDYVNIFRNPNTPIATDPVRFRERVEQISRLAELDRERLLQWIAAFCALSLAWDYYPEGSPQADLTVARFALTACEQGR